MTRLNGTYSSGLKWSAGMRVTSNQSLAALSTTMLNAWTTAWTDAVHGLKLFYAAGTDMTGVTVASLDATMKFTFKQVSPGANAGASGGTEGSYDDAVTVSLRSTGTKRWQRGHFQLPALDPQFVTANKIQAVPAGKIKLAVVSVQTAIQSDGSTVFVCGLKDHKLLPGTAFAKTVINLPFEVSDKIGSQSNRTQSQIPTYY